MADYTVLFFIALFVNVVVTFRLSGSTKLVATFVEGFVVCKDGFSTKVVVSSVLWNVLFSESIGLMMNFDFRTVRYSTSTRCMREGYEINNYRKT